MALNRRLLREATYDAEFYPGLSRRLLTDVSCNGSGKFYTCEGNATEFVGCCQSDPCKDGKGICPKKDLTRVAFSTDIFNKIPPQNCSDPKGPKVWWTCSKNNPPFMGCCAKDPCNTKGCADSDLIAAKLSSDRNAASIFLTPTPTGTPSPTSSPHPTETPAPEESSGLHPGAIAGIVVGALALIGIIVALLIWKMGWRLRNKERESRIIADFPAAYIPNALPDMGAHKTENYGGGAKGDGSYRDSFVSSVSPDATATRHPSPPADQRHFSMQSIGMLGASGVASQGQYARVSDVDHDVSPEPSPRFNAIPEHSAVELDGGSAAPPQYPERTEPHPYAQQYSDGRPDQHGPEAAETAPLTGGGGAGAKWVPYRPN